MISNEKQSAYYARRERRGINDNDLIEKFILGSGSGGQKINKTSSCVYIKHLPTGIEIKCQQGLAVHRGRQCGLSFRGEQMSHLNTARPPRRY